VDEPREGELFVVSARRHLAVDPGLDVVLKGLLAGDHGHDVHAQGKILRLLRELAVDLFGRLPLHGAHHSRKLLHALLLEQVSFVFFGNTKIDYL